MIVIHTQIVKLGHTWISFQGLLSTDDVFMKVLVIYVLREFNAAFVGKNVLYRGVDIIVRMLYNCK